MDGKKRSIYFTILLRSKINFLLTYKKLYKKYLSLFFSFILLDDENSSKIEEFRQLCTQTGIVAVKILIECIERAL